MYQVPLTQIPSQAISFNQDGAYWQIRVYQSVDFMCADITRNGSPVITGVRCFGGVPLMPYDYMWLPSFGNFMFDTDGDYTNFGGSCNLYYMSQDEISQYLAQLMSLVI